MKGHVRERGKGNWYAVLSTRDQQTGKRKVKFISLPDAGGKREAQQALAHILAELDSGTLVEPKKTTAAVFLARWLVHVKTQILIRAIPPIYQCHHSDIGRCAAHQAPAGTNFRNVQQGPGQWPSRRQGRAVAPHRPPDPYDAETGAHAGVRVARHTIQSRCAGEAAEGTAQGNEDYRHRDDG